ncbi:RND efflux system outer membrane lipoprotein [Pseudomonas putida S11]|nr:RND efflux system outer membrane lipoprotein [Pseudomonas putida S11]
MTKSLLSLAVTAFILGGCSLIPDYQTPESPVAAQWPQGPAYSPTQSAEVAAAEQGWRQFFHDPALQQLIQTALVNNRDLRVAALNIDAYRAQYRIQRADLFPAVSANGSGSRQRVPANMSQTGEAGITSQYSATLGVSAYELDLFGRVRSLTEQALETYLSSEQARRSTQISLVASVANAYYTWQADQALFKLTEETLKTYEESYNLTRRSNEVGVASALDVSQARTAVERRPGQVLAVPAPGRPGRQQPDRAAGHRHSRRPGQAAGAQRRPTGRSTGRPAVGHPPASPGHPGSRAPAQGRQCQHWCSPRSVLPEHQPDCQCRQPEPRHGPTCSRAARATWLFQPQINLPIFNAGSLKASLDYSKIQKDINVAKYEKTIQTAFQEVSDGLAARKTFEEQLQAQRDLVQANQDYYRLAERRYRIGIDSNLTFLDAQRNLFSAQQALIGDRLSQLTSEVNLYKALGGGWYEQTGQANNQQAAVEAPKG